MGGEVEVKLVEEEGEEQINCRHQAMEEGMELSSFRIKGGGEEEVNRTLEEGWEGEVNPRVPLDGEVTLRLEGEEGEVNRSHGEQGEGEVSLTLEAEGEVDPEGEFTLNLELQPYSR